MFLELPKEGPTHPAMLPFPITTNQLTTIMAEAPPTPLSPWTIENTIANYTELTTNMLHAIVHKLVATLHKRDIDSFAKQNKAANCIHKLKDQILREF